MSLNECLNIGNTPTSQNTQEMSLLVFFQRIAFFSVWVAHKYTGNASNEWFFDQKIHSILITVNVVWVCVYCIFSHLQRGIFLLWLTSIRLNWIYVCVAIAAKYKSIICISFIWLCKWLPSKPYRTVLHVIETATPKRKRFYFRIEWKNNSILWANLFSIGSAANVCGWEMELNAFHFYIRTTVMNIWMNLMTNNLVKTEYESTILLVSWYLQNSDAIDI